MQRINPADYAVREVPTISNTAVRYAILSPWNEPAYVVTLVAEGDTVRSDDSENITFADIYTTETDEGRYLYARARITGTITAVNKINPDLPVGKTDLLLHATLAPTMSITIRTGDEYRVDGRTVRYSRSKPTPPATPARFKSTSASRTTPITPATAHTLPVHPSAKV